MQAEELLAESMAWWREAEGRAPEWGPPVPPERQAQSEAEMMRFVGLLQAEAQRPPASAEERRASHGRVTDGFVQFARMGLGFRDPHLKLLLDGGLAALGTQLARRARRADPALGMDEIFQANRNAWTACGLQMLYGLDTGLTQPVFAYSMLYPYTDNYLDDPRAPLADKVTFGARFGRRLAGERVEAANGHERCIWRMVELIESEYPRAEYPPVYRSLLWIHEAQIGSLLLQRQVGIPTVADVERLSFAKGGSSVLADAYLAAGRPAEELQRFAYHWGVVLQLGDDLQDVDEDLGTGAATVFSVRVGRGEPLDGVTAQALVYGQRVMGLMPALGEGAAPVASLIRHSSMSLLLRAGAAAGGYHTPEFAARLESVAPIRSGAFRAKQKAMGAEGGRLVALFEAFLAGGEEEPAFPMLPGTALTRG